MVLARTIKKDKKTYTIMDMHGRKISLSADDLKASMSLEEINLIDMQINKSGRLITKRVEVEKYCRKIYFWTGKYFIGYMGRKSREYKIKALNTDEQQFILFYGLARINQLPLQAKQDIIRRIETLRTVDEADLKSLFTDNENWNFRRYISLDTDCRDKVIELIYYVAGVDNGFDGSIFRN